MLRKKSDFGLLIFEVCIGGYDDAQGTGKVLNGQHAKGYDLAIDADVLRFGRNDLQGFTLAIGNHAGLNMFF